jgi:hypothetical protein
VQLRVNRASIADAFASSRMLRGLLVGIEPTDPPTSVVAAVLLIVAATGRIAFASARAGRIDPTEALRYEDARPSLALRHHDSLGGFCGLYVERLFVFVGFVPFCFRECRGDLLRASSCPWCLRGPGRQA